MTEPIAAGVVEPPQSGRPISSQTGFNYPPSPPTAPPASAASSQVFHPLRALGRRQGPARRLLRLLRGVWISVGAGTQMLFKMCCSSARSGFVERRDTVFANLQSGMSTASNGFYATSYQAVYMMVQCERDLSVVDYAT